MFCLDFWYFFFFFLRNKTFLKNKIYMTDRKVSGNIYFENSIVHSSISLNRRKLLTNDKLYPIKFLIFV